MVAGQAPGSLGWGEAMCSGPLAQLEQIHCPDHELESTSTKSWRETGRAGPPLCHPATYLQALLWCPRALLYLQELAEELMSACQPPAPAEGALEPEPEHVQRKRRSRRKKEEDTDSDDPTRDADFVPSQEVLRAEEEEEEEEEGSDTLFSEASEPELEAPRGHGGRTAATGVRAGAGALPEPLLACVPAPAAPDACAVPQCPCCQGRTTGTGVAHGGGTGPEAAPGEGQWRWEQGQVFWERQQGLCSHWSSGRYRQVLKGSWPPGSSHSGAVCLYPGVVC